ncbi:MAG: manganese efflux pump [Bacteroidales bacterium]|nr:manganese efflux pump [Bacteroidales bacterium]HOY39998.1 manganese efflux pump MntP family protein [Bacteroidales bacterium]HQP03304.1 manganese efflux pump MntP family protein [Bacteroidales bacterium]
MIEWILIALALNADCLAVSIATGYCIKEDKLISSLRIAIVFSIIQTLLPLLGWVGGMQLGSVISRFDHWIAFALLVFIGIRMVWGAAKEGNYRKTVDPDNILLLIVLGFATSIDALAVGVSLGLIDTPIWLPLAFIFGVTFFVSFGGALTSVFLSKHLKFKMEYVAGVILAGLGTRILITHLIA